MALDIGEVIEEGVERVIAKSGLKYVGLSLLASLITAVASGSLATAVGDSAMQAQPALALGLPAPVAGLLAIAGGIFSAILGIAGTRLFVSDETESIPREFFTRNLGWALLNLIVGGIIFVVAVGVGSIFFLIPGLFLLVSLYFWNIFVVVEDENFVEAFSSSWELTSDYRLKLFGLGIIVVVAVGIVNFLIGLILGAISLAGIPGITAITTILRLIPQAFTTAFSLAASAEAYNQLRE